MDLRLQGQTALVSASTGGIGQAIAEVLAREGTRVIINGRSSDTVQQVISTIKDSCPTVDLLPLVADIGTAEGCRETIAKYPNVDILINNLGIYEAVGFFEETDEAWQRLIEVNVMSGVRLARHYLKAMLERNAGRVVFISSESGLNPAPEMAHYSATKTLQLSLSRSLAEMTKGTRVTVNSVLPGPTMTENVRKFLTAVFPGVPLPQAEERFMRENRGSSLLMRFIQPAEIADVVAFLVSPRASAINGAAIRVEGGIVRHIA